MVKIWQGRLMCLQDFHWALSLSRLFARVGGGIYTKAADVGADLVGKVEAGIPEDDVRNPATIADNVGDNVGDVAGMGADLFGSYVATMLATMVLGREIVSHDNFGGIAPVLLPMVIAGLGLLFSIVGAAFVKIKNETDSVQKALNIGNWASIILTAIATYFLVQWMLPAGEFHMSRDLIDGKAGALKGGASHFTKDGVFMAILVGLIVGTLMSMITEYYTAMGKRPVLGIIRQSSTGHATNIIAGLAVGMESTVLPILVLVRRAFMGLISFCRFIWRSNCGGGNDGKRFLPCNYLLTLSGRLLIMLVALLK